MIGLDPILLGSRVEAAAHPQDELKEFLGLVGDVLEVSVVAVGTSVHGRFGRVAAIGWTDDEDAVVKALCQRGQLSAPHIAGELDTDLRCHLEASGIQVQMRSFASVRITEQAEDSCILIVFSTEAERFGATKLRRLRGFGVQASFLVRHARVNLRLFDAITKLKLITDAMPTMIAYWDKEERCRFANRVYLEWFGVAPEALFGMKIGELLGEELYRRNFQYIQGALRGVPQFFERDLRRAAYGDVRHTQAFYIPDIASDGVRGFFVLVVDVTELKRAQVEAVRAKEFAEAAVQVKSRVLANMSHEIRTPMNGIFGMIELMMNTSLNAEQREYLEAARQSTNHLLHVINDILDLSKIEAGQLTLSNEPFHLRDAITSALSSMRIQARHRGLATMIAVEADVPPYILGDSVRLRQIVVNLFGNALKFTSNGFIALRVSRKSSQVVFEVEDTGSGISAEKLEVIFAPFRQAEESLSQSSGGTGLGLSICRELVRMMGGELTVSSQVGVGSVFRFSIEAPECEDPRTETRIRVSASTVGEGRDSSRLNVLLAEDDAISARVQCAMLQKMGCVVQHVCNGLEAVEAYQTSAFDLILMDMRMPRMDGLSVTTRIRELEKGTGRRVPIVALTANAFSADRDACLEAGMDDFLTKPVHESDLRGLVFKLVK